MQSKLRAATSRYEALDVHILSLSLSLCSCLHWLRLIDNRVDVQVELAICARPLSLSKNEVTTANARCDSSITLCSYYEPLGYGSMIKLIPSGLVRSTCTRCTRHTTMEFHLTLNVWRRENGVVARGEAEIVRTELCSARRGNGATRDKQLQEL